MCQRRAVPTTYTYDANNRLIREVSDKSGSNVLVTYTYDDNGNLLSQLDVDNTAIVRHTYNGLNQLVSSVTGEGTITYTYNAQGIRTSRTVGLVTTHYLLDGGNVIGEVEGDEIYTCVRGVNLIFGRARYYLYNAHGDVVQLTNTNGELTKNYNYDAFGNEREPDETDSNPFRYCGEYYDTETGLYYLRARYYNPLIGRFTQEDFVRQLMWEKPNGQYLVDPLSLNHYTYCHNNPVLYADSNGHWIHILVGAAFGAIAGAVIEVLSQTLISGSNLKDVDWGLVGIRAFSGALGGALTATGVGAVASGAIVSGVENLCEQAYKKGSSNIDFIEVGVSVGVGAATGFVGGMISGISPFPEIPQNHFGSMSDALAKRIGNAIKYHLGKGAFKEIAKAVSYYYSQMATLMWKTVLRTLLMEIPKDEIINYVISQTNLSQHAIDEINSFLNGEVTVE